jgi:acyl-CoA reductase-like NAD-dependent aldehyde dehydrogenase
VAIAQLAGQRAANLKLREPFLQTSLELGGSDAVYVAADVDPLKAAKMLISVGRLHNSGQSYCATKRLFLHARIAGAFLAEAKALMEKEVPGSPLDPAATMGPLFGGPKAIANLMEMVTDAVASGAQLLTGGDVVHKDGYRFILPTLMTGVSLRMRIMQEESFGPILPVMIVQDDDEALAQINHPLFGLTTAVFTDDLTLQKRVIDAAQSGTVFINWCNDVQAEVAWNGWGHSGNSMAALSNFGFDALTRPKSIVKALTQPFNC